MNGQHVIGILLLAWVGWDLKRGKTALLRTYFKDQEPGPFWGTVALWTGLAVYLLATA